MKNTVPEAPVTAPAEPAERRNPLTIRGKWYVTKRDRVDPRRDAHARLRLPPEGQRQRPARPTVTLLDLTGSESLELGVDADPLATEAKSYFARMRQEASRFKRRGLVMKEKLAGLSF